MITKHNRLKAALAILDMRLKDFCEEIHVVRSTVIRYYKGKRVEKNWYLDDKLDKLWEEAMEEIKKHDQETAVRERAGRTKG